MTGGVSVVLFSAGDVRSLVRSILQGLVLLPCSFFCGLAFMSHAIMSGIGGCCLHARSSFSGGWPLPFCPMLFFMWPGVHSGPVSLFLLLDSCVVKQEGGAVGDEHLEDHVHVQLFVQVALASFSCGPSQQRACCSLVRLARLDARAVRWCWRQWAPEGCISMQSIRWWPEALSQGVGRCLFARCSFSFCLAHWNAQTGRRRR